MPDQKRDKNSNPMGDKSGSDRTGGERVDKNKDGNNEWLRDQVGEDHNLSGSSTYRTLPDQPEENSRTDKGEKPSRTSDQDVNERQSNR